MGRFAQANGLRRVLEEGEGALDDVGCALVLELQREGADEDFAKIAGDALLRAGQVCVVELLVEGDEHVELECAHPVEERALHDEAVVALVDMAVQVRFDIRCVIGLAVAADLDERVERRCVHEAVCEHVVADGRLGPERRGHAAHAPAFGDDHVVRGGGADYELGVVDAVFRSAHLRQAGYFDLRMVVLLVAQAVEAEITAIVAQADVVGIEVLPRPILGCHLGKRVIPIGDVLALVVGLHAIDGGSLACPELNGKVHLRRGARYGLMAGDGDFHGGRT